MLIPDLIDIGIDILKAVQTEYMDINMLKQEFGKDISFWGNSGCPKYFCVGSNRGVDDYFDGE